MVKSLETFGKRLLQARTTKKLTQVELAQKIGEYQSKYRGWESGIYEPNIATINKLAEVLDVSVEWLLTGRDYNIDRIAENSPPYSSPESEKINLLFEEMDIAARRDVLKYAEEKKLVSKILKKRKAV